MVSPQVFVGIDVAKAHLDIALRPTGTRLTVANNDAGIADLVTQLHGRSPARIVFEATGGLQRAVVAALAAAALPVVVVNPRQVRDGAKATGQLATTDALDARALAHFAEAIRAPPGGQRADGGTACAPRPEATTHHDADGRAEPPWECVAPSPSGHRGAYHLAQCSPGDH